MKTKKELLAEITSNELFLEVLIDIRDLLAESNKGLKELNMK